MTTTPRIKYDIAADVSGNADVNALANSLESLALTLDGDVKRSALASAQALRDLSSRSGAIDSFVDLKREAQDAARRLTEAQAAAQKMGRELGAIEQPTRAQAGQMQRLRDAVRSAKEEVTAKAQAVSRARAALQAYGVDTTNLAGKQEAIKRAIAQARAEVAAQVPAYQRSATAAAAAGLAQQRAAQQAGTAIAGMSNQVRGLEALQRTLVATLATVGVSFGVREIAQAADAYASLQARIRLVTGEGDAFTRSMQGVGEIAARTGADLEQTGNLFQRLAQAGKDAGQSTAQAVEQSLALTNTINQAIAVSGGSADASKAAITQLIQGLQSGVLCGEEFNSVMEQAPRLARALADGLGVTTGELRKMAEAGQLTTATVVGALQSQAATLRGEFEQMPLTIGRALQQLQNSWTAYIGEQDKANGSSAAVGRTLQLLSENISTVASALVTAGKAAAAFKLIDLAASLNAKATAAAAAARSIAAEAVATGQATAATNANTAATTANAAAKRAAAAAADASTAASGKAAAAQATVGQALTSTGTAAAGLLARFAGLAAGAGALWLAFSVGRDVITSVGTALGEGIARLVGYKDASEELARREREAADVAAAGNEIRARQAQLSREAAERTFDLTKESRALIG
jgi:tape measure domain-containing protein